MFDVNDDVKVGFQRIDVLNGPERRRRWSVEQKARIVQESLVPGTRVADIARRWQLCPQQIFGWRRDARIGHAEELTGSLAPAFVPIVAEAAPAAARQRAAPAVSVIEVKLAGAVVHVSEPGDGVALTAVLRAIRASVAKA